MKTAFQDNSAKNTTIGYGFLGAALALLGLAMTGCSGMEVGGKAWVSRVDERQESQRTYRDNVPLACYLWKNCNSQPAEVQGS
jgi:hypothetical protein